MQIQICTECRDMLPMRLADCQEARPGLLVSVFCTDLNLFYSIHCNFLFLHGLGWERCKTCKRLHKKKERKRQAHKQSQVKKQQSGVGTCNICVHMNKSAIPGAHTVVKKDLMQAVQSSPTESLLAWVVYSYGLSYYSRYHEIWIQDVDVDNGLEILQPFTFRH